MKKLVLIFFLNCLLNGFVMAQADDMQRPEMTNQSETGKSSSPSIDIKSVIHSFSLKEQFSTRIPELLDTSTIDFHIYTPMLRKGFSNTYLGYLGSPFISNNFFDRINYEDYYFNTCLGAYHLRQDDVKYYNTTTPFATLKYYEGYGEVEQLFNAFFTQNIDSVTNFGFRFDAVKGAGQYRNQAANHKNLNFFFSRNAEKYNLYASLITATNRVTENGGIIDSFVNIRRNPADLLVNFGNSIGPEIKTFSLFGSYEHLFGELPFLKHESELDSSFIPRYGIQYSAEISNYKRNFSESSVDTYFFDSTYFEGLSDRIDSSYYHRFSQILQLKVMESPTRKFTFGKRVYFENEIVSAMHPVPYGERTYTFSNLILGGELYNRSNNFLRWSGLARFTLLGRNFGDAFLKGSLNKPLFIFKDTILLNAEGWYRDISANIFQEHWQDNHFKWDNNFSKQHEIIIKANVDWNKIHLNSGVNYAMMSNFIYNGKDSKPAQLDGSFSILSFWINKEFLLGPVRWNNKFIWQESSNKSVIHIPSLNLYSSLSVNGLLFKVMKYQLGVEVYYNSEFNADKYEPSTTRFYLQDDMITGGYPQLNAFVNAKLKRTSAFARLTHFNSSFSGGNFFSSPFYPINQSAFQFSQVAFQFGFIWSFYD